MALLNEVEQMRQMSPQSNLNYWSDVQQLQAVRERMMLRNKDRALYNSLYPTKAFEIRTDIPIDPTFGQSKYDASVSSVAQMMDLTDFRANSQNALEQATHGLAKAAGMTATTAGNIFAMIPAFISALPKSQYDDVFSKQNNTLFNRWMYNMQTMEMCKMIQDVDDWLEKTFPNYRTHEEQNELWLKHAIPFTSGSTNFWFDDIIKNIGFSFGSLFGAKTLLKLGKSILGLASKVPVVGTTASKGIRKATGELSSLGRHLNTAEKQLRRTETRKLYTELGKQGTLDEVIQSLSQAGNLTEHAQAIQKELTRRAKNRGIFEEVTGSIIGAFGEAQFEAATAQQEFVKAQHDALDKWFSSNDIHLYTMYQKALKDDPLMEMSFDDDKAKIYADAVEEINMQSYHLAHDIFAWESAVLSLTNFCTFRRFFNSGYSSHTIGKAATKFTGRSGGRINLLDDEFIRRNFIVKDGKLMFNEKAFTKAKILTLTSPIREGGEEMAQRFISSYNEASKTDYLNGYFKQYCEDSFNPKYARDVKEDINATAYAFRNTFLDSEGWLEGFSGLILGLLGGRGTHKSESEKTKDANKQDNDEQKSRFQRLKDKLPKRELDSGLIYEWRKINNTQELINNTLKDANAILNNPNEQERLRLLLIQRATQERMENAIVWGSRNNFKDEELNDLLTTLRLFDVLGQREVFNNILDGISNTDYNTVVDEFNKDDFTISLKEEDRNITAGEFVDRVQKEVNNVRKTLDIYDNAYKIIDELVGDNIDENYKHALSVLATRARDKGNRILEMVDDLRKESPVFKNLPIIQSAHDYPALMSALNEKVHFQDYINGIEKINNDIIQDDSISKEEKQNKIDKAITDLSNKLITDFLEVDQSISVAQKIYDLAVSVGQHLDLTNEYKTFLMHPNLMQQIERTVEMATAENKSEDAEQEIRVGTELKGLSLDNIREQFLNQYDKNATALIIDPNVANTLNELENAGSKKIESTLDNLKKALTNILATHAKDTNEYKQAQDMYNLLLDLLRAQTKEYSMSNERNKIVEQAANDIEKLIDNSQELTKRMKTIRASFDKNRCAFVTNLISETLNEKPFSIEIVQDCVHNDVIFVCRYGNHAVTSFTLSNDFRMKDGKDQVVISGGNVTPQKFPNAVLLDQNEIVNGLIQSFAELVQDDEFEVLKNFIKNKMLTTQITPSGSQTHFRDSKNAYMPFEHADIRDVKTLDAKGNVTGVTKGTEDVIKAITHRIKQLQAELNNTQVEETQEVNPETSPKIDAAAKEVPQDVIDTALEMAAEEAPEDFDTSDQEQETHDVADNEETIDQANEESDHIARQRVETAVGATAVENQVKGNDHLTIPVMQYDSIAVNQNRPNKTIKANVVLSKIKHEVNTNETGNALYDQLLLDIYTLCNELGVYDFLNKNGAPMNKKVRFRIPQNVDSIDADRREYFKDNVLEIVYEDQVIGYRPYTFTGFEDIKRSGMTNGFYNLEAKVVGSTKGVVVESDQTNVERGEGHSQPTNQNAIKQIGNANTYEIIYMNDNGQVTYYNKPNQGNTAGMRQQINDRAKEQIDFWARPGIITVFTARYGNGSAQSEKLLSPNEEKTNAYCIRACRPAEWSAKHDRDRLINFADLMLEQVRHIKVSDHKVGEWNQFAVPINMALWDNFLTYLYLDDNESQEKAVVRFSLTSHENKKTGEVTKVILRTEMGKIKDKKRVWNAVDGDQLILIDNETGETATPEQVVDFLMHNSRIKIDNETGAVLSRKTAPIHSVTSAVMNGNGMSLTLEKNLTLTQLIENEELLLYSELEPYNVSPEIQIDNGFSRPIVKEEKVVAPESNTTAQTETITMSQEEVLEQPKQQSKIGLKIVDVLDNNEMSIVKKIDEEIESSLDYDDVTIQKSFVDKTQNTKANLQTPKNLEMLGFDKQTVNAYKKIYTKLQNAFKDDTQTNCNR